MKKYLVVGGTILGKIDGDMHYISPIKLVRLYDVPRHECILARDWGDSRVRGLDITKYTVLEPDYHGKYDLEHTKK